MRRRIVAKRVFLILPNRAVLVVAVVVIHNAIAIRIPIGVITTLPMTVYVFGVAC